MAAAVQQNRRKRRKVLVPRPMRKPAFTLVELLVVIFVLALIASVAMPVLMRARSNAHRSACFNNIHQCGLAVSMYLEDYDNVYPTYRVDARYDNLPDSLMQWHDDFCRAAGLQPGLISWVSLTRPYIVNRQRTVASSRTHINTDVYHCPADDERGLPTTSYEYKMLLANGMPLSDIHFLGATALLWEQWAFHSVSDFSEHDRRAEMNIMFVDNHAAWIRLSDTINARYGSGPDLHWLPSASSIPTQFREEDVAYY